ncbi:MAG: DUF1501 domain-containing protein [Gemmatimonadaceae bacterium]|nr:DUF1501 domain-containing protein [Gemmatimonadaceae bacterium]
MSDIEQDDDCGCPEYRELSRRQFVGAAAAGGSMAVGAAFFPAWLPKVVLAETYASTRDVILSVFMRGGADGLSLCVPFGDPNYYASRTTIAVPRPDAVGGTKGIALDNFFAFPPAMGALMPAYNMKDLLVVHATGQFNGSRSHFDAQRYMEVGKPNDAALVTGWLGRHLASSPPIRTTAPLRALGLASGLQKTLVGGPKTLPIANPANFNIGGSTTTQDARLAVIQGDYADAPSPVNAAALDATNTVALLRAVGIAAYRPANGAVYPTSSFGSALRSVAALIKADVGIEAAQVDIGGWDTHSGQDPLAGSMYRTMKDFADSLAAFYADVITGQTVNPTTAVAFSEFGRNVRENGSYGTDHGRGTALFAIGKNINGGRVMVNGWPGLAREVLDAGQDLKVTMDYRDVLSEIVQNRLGNTNLDYIFPSWQATMRGVTR